jgi:hypothetical protein
MLPSGLLQRGGGGGDGEKDNSSVSEGWGRGERVILSSGIAV